jgi:hypothetical protein
MLHSIGYLGQYERDFAAWKTGVRHYRHPDGTLRAIAEKPNKVDGVWFGYMERTGKQFFAVRAQYDDVDVSVKRPVLLIPSRHTDGKGFGPQAARFGNESAHRLLADMAKENPEAAGELQRIAQKAGLGSLSIQ